MLLMCLGMNRGGSTLQYNVARRLVEKAAAGKGEGYYVDPDEENVRRQLNEWQKDALWHVIKSHKPPDNIQEMCDSEEVKVFYIYRDIRDVAASLKKMSGQSGEELLKALDRVVDAYDQIALTEAKSILKQRYETVMEDLPTMTLDIAEFLGINTTTEMVSDIVASCSIQSSQKASAKTGLRIKAFLAIKTHGIFRRLGFSHSVLNKLWILQPSEANTLLHPNHVSKTRGRSGVWKNTLSIDEIEMIHGRHKEWLINNGYDFQDSDE